MNVFLIGLVAGVFVGAFGLLAISLMISASRADDALERYAEEERVTTWQGPAGRGEVWHDKAWPGKALDLPLPPRDSA